MNHSSHQTLSLISVLAMVVACTGRQDHPHTADNGGDLPPNSADIHQAEMKESEQVSDERQEEALEEATEDVDDASVIKTDERDLKTDDVDTEPND